MNRKIFISIMLVVAILVAISGCTRSSGSSTSNAGQNQLVLNMDPTGLGDIFADMVVAFKEKYPEIEVIADIDQGSSARLQPLMVAGNPPDVVFVNLFEYDLFGGIIAHQYQDVEFIMNEKVDGTDNTYMDLFSPSIIEAASYQGKVMLAPCTRLVTCLVYDKKMLRDAGLTPPKTAEELIALAGPLADRGIALYAYTGVYASYVLDSHIALAVYAYGGEKAYNDSFYIASKGGWYSDAVKRALQDFVNIRNNGMLRGTVALDHIQSQMELLNRRVAFVPTGSWFEVEMGDSIPADFEIGFIPVPAQSPAGIEVVGALTNGLAVPANAKNPENAKKFIQFFYSAEGQRICCEYGLTPSLANIDEKASSYFTQSEKELYDYIARNNVVYVDLMPEMIYPTLYEVLSDNINLLVLGEITVDQFCDAAENEAERIRNDPAIPKVK